jgi:hypothetical protein
MSFPQIIYKIHFQNKKVRLPHFETAANEKYEFKPIESARIENDSLLPGRDSRRVEFG